MLRFWRSPADQPFWARPALLGIAALAAVLYSWNIQRSGYAHYYAVAVKSMSVSWEAFFYGALDPGATITLDKLAGAFVPQALSARVFGFHPWSLTLPQVLWGVLSVLVLYRVVRRWLGPAAGLLAAGLFALTPIVASMFGHSMVDGALTLCLLLAADAFAVALAGAKSRWLVLSAFWIGVGFQTKMLQAWMVVPAFAVTYLLVAPAPWRRRVGHLAVAGVTMVAVSLSWALLYVVTPAKDRPYVDGTTNNHVFSMVFGYNGLERFGVHVPGTVRSGFTDAQKTGDLRLPPGLSLPGAPAAGNPAQPAQPGTVPPPGDTKPEPEPEPKPEPGAVLPPGDAQPAPGPAPGAPPGPGAVGTPGAAPAPDAAPAAMAEPPRAWHKLVDERYATQVGWLYPLALAGFAAGLFLHHRTRRGDPVWGMFVMWGLWLATFAVVLSRMTVLHSAYLASLAPALAALAAAGVVLSLRLYRDGRLSWPLPSLIVAQLVWTGWLASRYADFLPWLTWLSLGGAALAAAALTARGRLRRAVVPVAVFGFAAVLAVPGAWGLSVLDAKYAGSAFEAGAGPSGPVGVDLDADTRDTLTDAQRRLDRYLVAQGDGAAHPAAMTWQTAGEYIIPTGRSYLPLGGFSGQAPQPTLARIRQLVDEGELRHVVLGRGGGLLTNDSEMYRILVWAASACRPVPPAEHGGDATLLVFRCDTAG
ncbi:glycosyltransferase family 39 protein [Streptomyces yaizuensis]|uniref:Glycosyltransferase family 39 protein n=1 Tax=Streptomyces yaizuensis TaxID=2989713 RepID=A0ABQ5P9G3_9ACTN|nr:glycosyltransferase family 39 protein [Streptomyces sp. YSPA8]GLF99210.1 glycosyltransferase family 39 protein [Streptomyces sp. YSPA8]